MNSKIGNKVFYPIGNGFIVPARVDSVVRFVNKTHTDNGHPAGCSRFTEKKPIYVNIGHKTHKTRW